ncbi:hypothetical protein EUGRSUZ_F02444 [Eucalyptus grandis]|uniref:Uncharacterized protein n=2 Tax=Eucalyptus grandis TaxID=71139 RepID=A0ACC3LI44_EUCGR|nr:hypothetical protein EUGRSUZ_F02444 [Eucalyptus grandis]
MAGPPIPRNPKFPASSCSSSAPRNHADLVAVGPPPAAGLFPLPLRRVDLHPVLQIRPPRRPRRRARRGGGPPRSEGDDRLRLALDGVRRRLCGHLLQGLLPLQVLQGTDIGECTGLDSHLVDWISSHLPGLDSAGCGAFEMENITFVSLNSVALLCGNNALRFGVEEVIERESLDFRTEIEGPRTEMTNDLGSDREMSPNFAWRENSMASGSGPVLLLHLPLHSTGRSRNDGKHCHEKAYSNLLVDVNELQQRRLAGTGPYELSHTIPPNATEYIFQALRPRIVFSGHSRDFCDYLHPDGTREVTVPPMSWHARDDPGFVIATFRQGKSVGISHCYLGRQSCALIYIFILVLSMLMTLMVKFLKTFQTMVMAVALL